MSHKMDLALKTCMVSFRKKPFFLFFKCSNDFFNTKSVFLEVIASLRWPNDVSCLFLSFPLITSGV